MSEAYEIIILIIETPYVVSRIGYMMAAAIILGAMLIESYHLLLKIAVIIGVLISFEEWIHFTLIQNMATTTHPTTISGYATGIAIVIFTVCLGAGAVIGIWSRRREARIIEAGNSVMYEIENGGLQKK